MVIEVVMRAAMLPTALLLLLRMMMTLRMTTNAEVNVG